MISVEYSALARRDLERIDRYHRQIDPDLATTLSEQIVAAVGLLRELPYAGPATLTGERRKWRVAGTKYLVFYRVSAHRLRVLRIVHAAQRAATP